MSKPDKNHFGVAFQKSALSAEKSKFRLDRDWLSNADSKNILDILLNFHGIYFSQRSCTHKQDFGDFENRRLKSDSNDIFYEEPSSTVPIFRIGDENIPIENVSHSLGVLYKKVSDVSGRQYEFVGESPHVNCCSCCWGGCRWCTPDRKDTGILSCLKGLWGEDSYFIDTEPEVHMIQHQQALQGVNNDSQGVISASYETCQQSANAHKWISNIPDTLKMLDLIHLAIIERFRRNQNVFHSEQSLLSMANIANANVMNDNKSGVMANKSMIENKLLTEMEYLMIYKNVVNDFSNGVLPTQAFYKNLESLDNTNVPRLLNFSPNIPRLVYIPNTLSYSMTSFWIAVINMFLMMLASSFFTMNSDTSFFDGPVIFRYLLTMLINVTVSILPTYKLIQLGSIFNLLFAWIGCMLGHFFLTPSNISQYAMIIAYLGLAGLFFTQFRMRVIILTYLIGFVILTVWTFLEEVYFPQYYMFLIFAASLSSILTYVNSIYHFSFNEDDLSNYLTIKFSSIFNRLPAGLCENLSYYHISHFRLLKLTTFLLTLSIGFLAATSRSIYTQQNPILSKLNSNDPVYYNRDLIDIFCFENEELVMSCPLDLRGMCTPHPRRIYNNELDQYTVECASIPEICDTELCAYIYKSAELVDSNYDCLNHPGTLLLEVNSTTVPGNKDYYCFAPPLDGKDMAGYVIEIAMLIFMVMMCAVSIFKKPKNFA